ncbi:MAG: hypothetical protein AAF709_12115 [Pseudomonadota bacterium]
MRDNQANFALHKLDSTERVVAIVALALFGLFLTLIWAFKYPPLLDYSNHLARVHVFENLAGPDFAPYFDFEIGVPTNLALDALTYVFAMFLPIDIAGRLFLSVVIGLTMFAPIFLAKIVHGKLTLLSLLFSVFLFNDAVLMGFLNFLFGTALAIFGFGIHLVLDKRGTRAWKRVLAGSLIAIAVFISHVDGFAVYAICIGGYYLVHLGIRDLRTLALNALQFVPVSVLLVVFVAQSMTTDITHSDTVGLPQSSLESETSVAPLQPITIEGVEVVERPANRAAWEYYLPLNIWVAWKKMSRLWRQYGEFAWLITIFSVLLMGLYFGNRAAPSTPALLAPVVLLLSFAVFLPSPLWGAHNVHWRFFIPAALFTAGILKAPRSGTATRFGLLAGIIGLSVLQSALVYGHFKRADAHQQLVLQLFEEIPEGAKVLSIAPTGSPHVFEHPVPFTHMVTLGVIENNSFVPSLFAYSIQQPLRYRPPYNAYATEPFFNNMDGVDWRAVSSFYDYVLVLDHDGETGGAAADWLKRIPVANDPMDSANPHIAATRILR